VMGYPEPVSTTESIPLPTADIQVGSEPSLDEHTWSMWPLSLARIGGRKLMLLGADSVGKSCLWSSWDTNTFPESPQPTVGGMHPLPRVCSFSWLESETIMCSALLEKADIPFQPLRPSPLVVSLLCYPPPMPQLLVAVCSQPCYLVCLCRDTPGQV